MRRIFVSIIIILFACGCYSGLDFKRPEVISVSPIHNSTLVLADSQVVVQFSKSMDTVKTNNEFSLSSTSGKIEGFFSWENEDKRLIFTPSENLPFAEKFTIRITGSAEDKDGNDLKDEFVSVFYINGENTSPYVISYTPAENSIGNLPETSVSITFSEPVNLNTIYEGITISPSIQGRFEWNAGISDSENITFIPLYGFEYGVTYTVKINQSVTDISGNSLREPVNFSFTVGDDFIKPTLNVYQDISPALYFDESYITHGAEKNSRIVIVFSETIKNDNLRSSVTVSPSASFYITSSETGGLTTAYINFTDVLESEQAYTLKISSSITDLQGNALAKDYRYCFITDGTTSISPIVSAIGDLATPVVLWIPGDIQLLTLQSNPLYYNNIITDFTSGSGGSAIQINPLTLSIYVENIAGSGGEATVINIDWPDDGAAMKYTRLKFGLYNVLAGNTYKIVIKGGSSGLRDINGNYMKEDFVQIIKFP